MYQQGQSYRLGDYANSSLPDGDHYVRVVSCEPATTSAGDPQLKIGSVVLGNGPERHHTWYYSLKQTVLWRLFNDLIAAGFEQNYDPGPPDAPRYAAIFGPGLINRCFHIKISTRNDFSNTQIRGPVQVDPSGQPLGVPQVAPQNGAGAPYGNGSPVAGAPMNYGAPQPAQQPYTQAAPQPAGTPTAYNGPAGGVPANNVAQPVPAGNFAPAMSFGNAAPVNPGAPQTAPEGVSPAQLFRTV